MMYPKIAYINVLLGFLIAVTGFMAVETWMDTEIPLSSVSSKKSESWPQVLVSKRELAAADTFHVICENNLFSQERQEIVRLPVKGEQPKPVAEKKIEPPKVVPESEIQLKGVMILPNFKAAFVNNPDTGSGGPPQLRLTEGDKIGSYIVKEIENDYVILEKNGERFEARLFEKKKDAPNLIGVQREKSEPNIVSAGSTPVEASPAQGAEASEKKDEPEFEWFKTPFGMIKRLKKK